MADDKTIKIKLDDGSSSDPPPVDEDAIRRAREDAKRVEEALNSFSFATEEFEDAVNNAEKVGKRRGRPPKDEDPNEPTPDALGKEKPLPLKILQNLQKFVTAFEGVNGRATKALAVLTRSTKAYYEHQAKAAAATAAGAKTAQAATAATATGVKAAATVTTATTAASVAMGVVSKVLGVFAIVVAGLSAAFLVAAVAAKGFSKLIENLQEVVKDFSGTLNLAKARTQVAVTQEEIRSANRAGNDLADLEETNGQLKTELISLKTEFIRLIEPFIKVVGEGIVKVLQFMELIFKALNAIQDLISNIAAKVLEPLSWIPIIGKYIKWLQDWLEGKDIDASAANKLNQQVEDLFAADQFDFKKKGPAKRFLP